MPPGPSDVHEREPRQVGSRTFRLCAGADATAGGGIAVAVESTDTATLAWLEEFFVPPFPIDANRAADVVVRVDVDTERHLALARDRDAADGIGETPFFRLDQGVVALPTFRSGVETVVHDSKYECFYVVGARGVDIVGHARSARYRGGVMRVVREIVSVVALSERAHLLHAGGIEIGGDGIVVAGPKESGKTTLLCYLARAHGARLLANDRVLVWKRDRELATIGIPTVVGIRPPTAALFPDIVDWIPAVERPSALTLAELHSVAAGGPIIDARRRLRLSPAQFARGLGVARSSGARLRALLFPERGGDGGVCAVDLLSSRDARTRLEDARFGAQGSTVATVFERRWGGRDAAASGDVTAAENRRVLEEAIASSVPCYRVRMPLDAFRGDVARMRLLDVLDRRGPRGTESADVRRAEQASRVAEMLARDDVAAVLADLGSPAVAAELLTTLPLPGSIRSTYRVTLADGRTVKLRRAKRPEKAERASQVLTALADARFAAVLLRRGDIVVEEWIEGTALPSRPPLSAHVARAAAILAELHHAPIGATATATATATSPAVVLAPTLACLESLCADGLLDPTHATRLAALAQSLVPVSARVGATHNDFCGENLVLDETGDLRVIDNETVDVGFLDYDLARTWYRWDLDGARWDVFLASYAAAGGTRPAARTFTFWKIAAVTKSAAVRLTGTPATLGVALAKLAEIATT